jgi:hypothetical protein
MHRRSAVAIASAASHAQATAASGMSGLAEHHRESSAGRRLSFPPEFVSASARIPPSPHPVIAKTSRAQHGAQNPPGSQMWCCRRPSECRSASYLHPLHPVRRPQLRFGRLPWVCRSTVVVLLAHAPRDVTQRMRWRSHKMHEPTHNGRAAEIAMAGCTICPRCDGVDIRELPRVTRDHAEWCECRTCGHLWLPPWLSADRE